MELVKDQLDLIKSVINDRLSDCEPWQVVAGTAAAAWFAAYIYLQLTHKTPFTKRFKKALFRVVRKLPPVRNKIEKEMKKVERNKCDNEKNTA